jgi:hypothetical protein
MTFPERGLEGPENIACVLTKRVHLFGSDLFAENLVSFQTAGTTDAFSPASKNAIHGSNPRTEVGRPKPTH